MFQPFDVVRLRNGLPEHDLPAGTEAVILEYSEVPDPHYQIEVTDDDGRALFIGAVTPDQVESTV